MRNKMLCTVSVIVSLFQLAGCQTTRGLAEIPADADLTIPKEIFIYVLPPDNSHSTAKWTDILAKFVPKDRILTSPKKIDVFGAHVVTLRIKRREPVLYNVPLHLSAVTLFIMPGCAIALNEADFEVARAMSASYDPVNLHYSYSETECIWLPLAFQNLGGFEFLLRRWNQWVIVAGFSTWNSIRGRRKEPKEFSA